MEKEYLKIHKKEGHEIFYVVLIYAFMFSLAYSRVNTQTDVIINFILFFFFFGILIILKQIFMKFVSYKNGFEITLYTTKIDNYGFRNYDRMSYYIKKHAKKINSTNPVFAKGIPTTLIALLLYILSLGLIIFPSVYRYKIKEIPHKFFGTRQYYEKKPWNPKTINNYRYSKGLFAGFLFYIIFACVCKALYGTTNSHYFLWFIFAIYWILFFDIIPILGTQGYDLFRRYQVAWWHTLTLIVLSFLAVLVFNNLVIMITAIGLGFIIIFLYMVHKGMV